MPAHPTLPNDPAIAALRSLVSDPDNPKIPRLIFPNPSPDTPGRTLAERRQRHRQETLAYRRQIREAAQAAGIEMVWVTETTWGQVTREPI